MHSRPERVTGYQDLVLYTRFAAEAAQHYLDDNGRIDYALFGYNTLGALAAGPGFVTEPAPVTSHHLDTTTEEFMHRSKSNNFHLLFDDVWGLERRSEPFYQRFAILFPDFASALRTHYQEYARRVIESQATTYPFEPELFEPLRTAYGIMAQLIDLNDTYWEETRVRDIDPTQVLRA